MKNKKSKKRIKQSYWIDGFFIFSFTKGQAERILKRAKKADIKRRIEEWKLRVIERDNWTCQRCDNKLEDRKHCHPHHIIALQAVLRSYQELLDDINNGVLTCYSCHKRAPFSAHQGGFEFSYFLMKKKPEQYEFLKSYLESKNSL